ncbi:MAG: hypothetical protein KAQ75_13395, partial [Bacteroidales bacterium]|nr:hypothetical protein [Bacteroidales bacterium]
MIHQFVDNSIKNKKKLFALLIDPDNHNKNSLSKLTKNANNSGVDLIFVGGSLLNNDIDKSIEIIQSNTKIPILLFP